MEYSKYEIVNNKHLKMLNMLEERGKILRIRYNFSYEMAYFEIITDAKSGINKYYFATDEPELMKGYMDLYRQHEINKNSKRQKRIKIKNLKTNITALAVALSMGVSLVGAKMGYEHHKFKEEVDVESKKIISQIMLEAPTAKLNSDIVNKVYEFVENELKEKKAEEAKKERISSTNQTLEDYYREQYENSIGTNREEGARHVYEQYLEYLNNSNATENNNENAKTM